LHIDLGGERRGGWATSVRMTMDDYMSS